ncbi:NUDIX domain-containing protein [Bdellovibrio bacteriovorus]|uniref:NUDIX domain-containing protein n=1 Tax=Bdellovibrio bacteriovorus TaxID=959 RepID=UPI0035A87A80
MLRTFKDDREFYASLPRKRIGAGVLLFYKHELLIVQPTYNPGWILPGGTVEGEESPLEGLHREVKEELGISIEPTHLISVDYISNRDVKGEYIQFLFVAKDLTESQAQKIQLQPYELRNFNFVNLERALELLTPAVARRVESSIEGLEQNQGSIYLENGRPYFEKIKPITVNL